MRYTELQVTSNFSFLRGASHPEELVEQAHSFGHPAIAITDRNTLAGIVRGHVAAKKKGMRFIPACRLDLLDGPSLLAYPTDQDAYSRLSALLTRGNLRAEKGKCHLYKADVYEQAKGIKFMIVPPASLNELFDFDAAFYLAAEEYREAFGSAVYLAAVRLYGGDDAKQLFRLSQLALRLDLPLTATNDVYYHEKGRRQLQDVLTCIREKCTIYNAGYRLHANAERHMKHPDEMERLFRAYPDAIRRSWEIAEACQFSLDSLRYVYPEELTTEGRTPIQQLAYLAWMGAADRFGAVIPEKIGTAIVHELEFIEKMDYAAFFLTVWDLVRFANEKKILCQGRGSAANSTICYCLGVTAVDPTKFDLLFERFISPARNEPPDIDVDFEHERREEVIQYIYNKYGRDRAAIVATVTQQREKGAIRDVGKAMGLSVDTISQLAGSMGESFEKGGERGLVMELTGQLMGFPRQLGQHTGGFVITQGKLSDLCPIINARMEERTNIEWNKDDIDALGFVKVDVLALGMLTCIRKAFDLATQHYGLQLTLATIPPDDPAVYAMVTVADTIGVFQIESRAQQAMLPRLRPTCFYDLVIEVAIVRPGPILGDMVHPYLRRRNGEEAVEFPSKDLEVILGRTLGVPLFQEQAMKIAIVAAGFTPAEADELRRSMATFKSQGLVTKFKEKLVSGMMKNGYTEEYALRVFRQLEGFGSYGFPESHAASFAQLVYTSAWIKCYYPDVFACAILNSLPMGFYQPSQLVIDARNHGVEFRPVDINISSWNYTLEEIAGKYHAVRIGFRQIKGIKEEEMNILIAGRKSGFASIHALQDAGVTLSALERLADADAFRSIGLDRRQALWEVSALADRPIALFEGQPSESCAEQGVLLPVMTAPEHVVQDYASTALSLKAHPVSFVREKLDRLHIVAAKDLPRRRHGEIVKAAGLVLVRQRPGTAGGTCFITLEDETGTYNLIVWASLFAQYRKEILGAKLLMVEGELQIVKEVIHIIVSRCFNLNKLLIALTPARGEELPLLTLSRADENLALPNPDPRVKEQGVRQAKIFPEARNFK